MPAPKCTCRYIVEVAGLVRTGCALCPLHEAAPDLWIALEKLIDTLTWAGLRNPTLPFSLVAEDVLQGAIALRKANPHRAQEVKADGR